jgi:hypothetical protein
VGEISFRGCDMHERVAHLNQQIAASARGQGYGLQVGQSLLLSEGFERDPTVMEVCRLVLSSAQWKTASSRNGGD